MSRTRPNRCTALLGVILCVALPIVGCDTSLNLDIATIRVTVTAVGNNLDPDGYTVRVTGDGEDQSQAVDVNGEVVFVVPSGRYTVGLTDLADNCIVDLSPQVAQVSSGETAELLFNTLCG